MYCRFKQEPSRLYQELSKRDAHDDSPLRKSDWCWEENYNIEVKKAEHSEQLEILTLGFVFTGVADTMKSMKSKYM